MANNPYVNKVQLANGTTLIDLSGDTVTSAADIVVGKIGHLASGEQVTGTASSAPNLQAKTNISPTTSSQTIQPDSGYDGLSSVQINAIPANFGDTTGDTAVAANLLAGVKAHTINNGSAVQITGTMINNGAISGSIDGLASMSYSVPAGHTSGGTVSLTSDIEDALAAI